MTKNKGTTKGRQDATHQRAVKTTTMSLTADERRFLQDSMKKKAATNDKYETAKSALEVTRSLTMSMVTAGIMTPEAATTIVGSAKDVAAKAKKKRRKSRRSDSDTSSDSSEESSWLRPHPDVFRHAPNFVTPASRRELSSLQSAHPT